MILMDRENARARGWSHVHSDAPTLGEQAAELHEFRRRVGAPASAFQAVGRWLHLDIKRGPRAKALETPGVRVFERTRDLVAHLRDHVTPNRARKGADWRGGPCICGEDHPAGHVFYVSCLSDGHLAEGRRLGAGVTYLAGPCPEHAEALGLVDAVQALAKRHYPDSRLYAFGTVSLPAEARAVGVLNDQLAA